MLQNIIFVILGLAGLYYGGDWLVTGSSRIALSLKMPPLIIGLTLVAIGTSAPELFVSVTAALQGSEGLALGNVIGSNIANVGLILGVTGIITVVTVHETLIKREIPILLGVTIFATILILDGVLTRFDGILLLLGFVGFNIFFYYLATSDPAEEARVLEELEISEEEAKKKRDEISLWAEAGRIAVGVTLLIVGARLMVIGATNLALALGVSELIIGVTMVAFGTSLPELATSLTAVFRRENDIAVGNIIGSNIANLLLVLGATAAVTNIDVVNETSLSAIEYIVMLLFSFMLLPFARNRSLSRFESAIFLGAYLAFIAYSFFLST